jgi:hypothetical protein
MKAIQVHIEVGVGQLPSKMIATCMGERSIERPLSSLPAAAAHALALLMCHQNGWHADLVYGLLPNGDEVFCFRKSGRLL